MVNGRRLDSVCARLGGRGPSRAPVGMRRRLPSGSSDSMATGTGCEGGPGHRHGSGSGATVPARAGAAGRRVGVAWVRAGVLALVAGGCGGGSPAGVAAGEATELGAGEAEAAAAASEATADGTLVVALRRLPGTLDPFGELDPWGQRIVDDLVFEGLTRRAGESAPFVEFDLADECRLSSAARDVWCHVRPGTRFHDGSAVTVDDVVWSLEFWLDPRRSGLRQRHGLHGLRRVEAADTPPPSVGGAADRGRWIHLEFERAEPLALERIAAMKVVPKARRRAQGTAFGRTPVGTGPMKVTAFETEQLALVRADTARRAPGVAALRFEEVGDGAAALVRARRGDVHVLAEMTPVHVVPELAKPGMAPRFRAFRLSPPRYDVLFYNLRRAPLGNVRLRGALDLALPRVALAESRDPMPAQPTDVPVDLAAPIEIDIEGLHAAKAAADWGSHGLPSRPDVRIDEQGRTAAASELDALGWRMDRGARRRAESALRIVLMWDAAPGVASTTARAVRDGWRKLGINVPQVTASFAYLLGLMLRGEFDVALARLATGTDADLFAYFHSAGPFNISGIADPELDAAIDAGRSASTQAERLAAQARVAERLRLLHPVSVLHAPTEIMLVSRRVDGLAFVDDLPRLDRLRLLPATDWP